MLTSAQGACEVEMTREDFARRLEHAADSADRLDFGSLRQETEVLLTDLPCVRFVLTRPALARLYLLRGWALFAYDEDDEAVGWLGAGRALEPDRVAPPMRNPHQRAVWEEAGILPQVDPVRVLRRRHRGLFVNGTLNAPAPYHLAMALQRVEGTEAVWTRIVAPGAPLPDVPGVRSGRRSRAAGLAVGVAGLGLLASAAMLKPVAEDDVPSFEKYGWVNHGLGGAGWASVGAGGILLVVSFVRGGAE